MGNPADLIRSRAGDTRVALRFEDESWTWDEYVRACSQRAAFLLDQLARWQATARRGADRQPARLLDVARRDGAHELRARRHQSHATRCGARARHHLHRLPVHRDRDQPPLVARRPRSRRRQRSRPGRRRRRRTHVASRGPRAVRRRAAPRRRGRRDGHVPTAVHVGDEWRAEGMRLVARTPVPQQLDHDGEHGAQRRRHPLHDDAAVPLERDHHRVLPVAHHRWRGCGSAQVLGVGFPPRRAQVRRHLLQLRGQAAVVHPGHARAARRRRQPDPHRVRQRSRRPRHRTLRDALRLHRRRRLRIHRGRRAHHPQPRDAEGRARDARRGTRDPRSRNDGGVSARAKFDGDGRLLNPDECIGEIVNKNGAAGFEGYYKNDEANSARIRNGWYWTGDLGYRDEDGWAYFGGRDFEWIRVDGENFAAAPIERILARHHDVVLAAVYAVPDAEVGDQVMATLLVRPGYAVRHRGVRRVPRSSRRTSARSGRPGTYASPRTCRSPRARSR